MSQHPGPGPSGQDTRPNPPDSDVYSRLQMLEEQNAELKATIERMNQFMSSYQAPQRPHREPATPYHHTINHYQSTYSAPPQRYGAPPQYFGDPFSRPYQSGYNQPYNQPYDQPFNQPSVQPDQPIPNYGGAQAIRNPTTFEKPNNVNDFGNVVTNGVESPRVGTEAGAGQSQHGYPSSSAGDDDDKVEREADALQAPPRWNRAKSKWEMIDDKFEEGNAPSGKSATYTKKMDTDHEKRVASEAIEIHSPHLKSLLVETDHRWHDLVEGNSHQVTLETPFYFFVWGWDKYEKACEPKEGDSDEMRATREDLKTLMQHIRVSVKLESYFKSRNLIKSSKKIKFEHLWTIFPHGCRVYARSYGRELQLFEVTDISSAMASLWKFRVACCAFDWDGSKFSTYTYDFFIKEYSGEKLISSLDVFPVEYYCNPEGQYDNTQLKKELVERGRRTFDLCKQTPAQCDYNGSALVSPTGPHRLTTKARVPNDEHGLAEEEVEVTSMDISSKVIVDNYAFLKSERNPMKRGDTPPLGRRIALLEYLCICPVCKASPILYWEPESTEEFDANDIRLMSLPPRLLGFGLKDKVWGQFSIDKLTPVGFGSSSHESPFWDELQLEEDSKKQLMALVKHHSKSNHARKEESDSAIDSKTFDVIEGKGQGLAILLHGPPGVGKTLTAETVAIATGRPLLTVSVAEIGTDAHRAEGKMTDVFEDAARWDAVLLMDEADVFVEERERGELEQNAFVSVLLRCLEYYDGIIILTTNRAKSIDGAVQSRITLAIQYHDLKPDQRLAIYRNRLRMVPDDEVGDRKLLEEKIANSPLAKKGSKVNGRQIRNIVAGARMLAKQEQQQLGLEHLLSVHDTTSEFINSMAQVMERQRGRRELD